MHLRLFYGLIGLLGMVVSFAQEAIPIHAQQVTSAKKNYQVHFASNPSPVPHNQAFSLEIWIRDLAGQPIQDLTLSVDARMPAHRHGMVRTPVVQTKGPGHFEVAGMLFHMPGRWELYFDITREGLTERVRTEVLLE